MAQHRNTSPELQPGQEDSAPAAHSPAQPAVLGPNVQACAATAPVAPGLRFAAPDQRFSKSRQDSRARSQADALPRQPSETQTQAHRGFASKAHRVLH